MCIRDRYQRRVRGSTTRSMAERLLAILSALAFITFAVGLDVHADSQPLDAGQGLDTPSSVVGHVVPDVELGDDDDVQFDFKAMKFGCIGTAQSSFNMMMGAEMQEDEELLEEDEDEDLAVTGGTRRGGY
eukprot:TRINITY_DN29374_c0_g1_i1.p2 TRINITY_DN29374_c0_g1~~TRINITY_DN29374_c0_g1_i1.p2  ORF type:complete len:130 (+),score=40.15 TRINITY_DN29374_c0_g1_i1:143-532(+)